MGAFSAWYWNVSSSSNFFGLAGAAANGNFFGLERSGASTAMLFGVSNDTDLSLFGIGGGSYTFASGSMSQDVMLSEAVRLEGYMTVLALANSARNGVAVNGVGGLAALIINTGSVATWIHHTYGRPE